VTALSVFLLLHAPLPIQDPISGGALKLEQAVYDVQSYDISIKVDPAKKTLAGTTIMEAKIVIPTGSILLDLDDPFAVSRVTDGTSPLRYDRLKGMIRVHFPQSKQPGDSIRTEIAYSGAPLIARNAPWDGGIMSRRLPGCRSNHDVLL
jgi:hypothetical protein